MNLHVHRVAGRMLFVGVLLACGACATISTGQQDTPASHYPPTRLVGKVRWGTDQVRLNFDVALLLMPGQQRVRLDLALPTGATGGILWVFPDRWMLYDPAANIVFTGVPHEMPALRDALAPIYQAPLALISGLTQLSPRWGFDKIPLIGSYSSEITAQQRWVVELSQVEDQFSLPWPASWRVQGPTSTLEVTWSRQQPLSPAELRLFEPRLPASVSSRSWRALQAVSDVTEYSAEAATNPVPKKQP